MLELIHYKEKPITFIARTAWGNRTCQDPVRLTEDGRLDQRILECTLYMLFRIRPTGFLETWSLLNDGIGIFVDYTGQNFYILTYANDTITAVQIQ